MNKTPAPAIDRFDGAEFSRLCAARADLAIMLDQLIHAWCGFARAAAWWHCAGDPWVEWPPDWDGWDHLERFAISAAAVAEWPLDWGPRSGSPGGFPVSQAPPKSGPDMYGLYSV